MLNFEEFNQAASSRGYKAKIQSGRPELFVIKTKNGVKAEINTKAETYIAGYNLGPEQREVLKDQLKASGAFQMTFPDRALAYAQYEDLEKFWQWVGVIESTDLTLAVAPTPTEKNSGEGELSQEIPMVSFEEFAAQCEARGYTGRIQPGRPELFIARTRNGVKVEINTRSRSYIAGYQLSDEEMAALKAVLAEQEALGVFKLKFPERKLAYAQYQGMEKFWEWARIIEGIDAIVAASRGFATKVFNREQAEQKIFEKIARTYQFALRLEHQNLLDTSRMLLEADKLDHLITAGQSVNAPDDNPYREHVVPCVLIHNEVIRILLEAGVLQYEVSEEIIHRVAKFIEDHLAIVLISREEQHLLDVTLGLRTSMPKDWKFGDSIYARLEAAEIEWDNPDEE